MCFTISGSNYFMTQCGYIVEMIQHFFWSVFVSVLIILHFNSDSIAYFDLFQFQLYLNQCRLYHVDSLFLIETVSFLCKSILNKSVRDLKHVFPILRSIADLFLNIIIIIIFILNQFWKIYNFALEWIYSFIYTGID